MSNSTQFLGFDPNTFDPRSQSVGRQTIVVRALFELTGWTDQECSAAIQSKSLVVASKRTAHGVSFLPFDQQVDRVGICNFRYLGHNMCTINSNNLDTSVTTCIPSTRIISDVRERSASGTSTLFSWYKPMDHMVQTNLSRSLYIPVSSCDFISSLLLSYPSQLLYCLYSLY